MTTLIARTTRAASAATTPAVQSSPWAASTVRVIHDAASGTAYLVDIPGSQSG